MKELENKRIENRKFARKRAKMLMAQEGVKNPCSPVKVASRDPITGAQTYKIMALTCRQTGGHITRILKVSIRKSRNKSNINFEGHRICALSFL